MSVDAIGRSTTCGRNGAQHRWVCSSLLPRPRSSSACDLGSASSACCGLGTWFFAPTLATCRVFAALVCRAALACVRISVALEAVARERHHDLDAVLGL